MKSVFRLPHRPALVLAAFVTFLIPLFLLRAGDYFPERGAAAIAQRTLEVEHPWVVLMVALEPGMEDFPTIAWLRMATGARLTSLYATNGEATPSDYSGETPGDLAGRRKLEALQSMSILGAECSFLNLRDAGIVKRRKVLEEAWNPDSTVARLVRAIRLARPDVIILSRDERSDSAISLRQNLLKDLLVRAIREARTARGEHGPATPIGERSWSVQRLFVDMGRPKQPVAPPTQREHPVWHMTYSAIGGEAALAYVSLRGQIASWWRSGARAYSPLATGAGKVQNSFERGLLLADAKLGTLAHGVSDVVARVQSGKAAESLKPLLAVLENVDYTIARETMALSNLDRRAIALWKNALENLRCSLLDVNVAYEMSDSLLTERQVFFLRFKSFSANIISGQTQILFPGVGAGDWIVTEGNSQVFPFSPPKEYKVLTPAKMEYTRPASQFGLWLPTLTTNFAFIIFHRDTVRERSFVYRKEIPLGIGPRGTAELLTPIVRLTAGEHLVYGLWNFMRDPLKGEAYILDSLAKAGPQPFFLPRKDEVESDTLTINWVKDVPNGDYVMDLRVWDRPRSRALVARKFDALSDTVHRVGLITGLEGSPVAEALRRLHIPVVRLDSGAVNGPGRDSLGTIILDRDAIALRPDCASHIPSLASWVTEGGRLVVLSQYERPGEDLIEGISFVPRPQRESTEPVAGDSLNPLLVQPNRIGRSDWEGWVVSRAMGSLLVKSVTGCETVVSSADAQSPLIVTARKGKGLVRFVALDLSSQLLNVHPGAYRLLANLVSAP